MYQPKYNHRIPAYDSNTVTGNKMFNASFRNGIVVPPSESGTGGGRIGQLETQMAEEQWARMEAENRVVSLENELALVKLKEREYKDAISQLEYELNELRCGRTSRLNSVAEAPVLPPPPEFRTKAKSCSQLLAVDYSTTSFAATSLSVGDIDSETEQEDDVFDSTRRGHVGVSPTNVAAGFSELSSKETPIARLCETQEQRDKLANMLAKEICSYREDIVLANKTISDVNKKIQHFNEISSQCPLRHTKDKSLPSHIRGFCCDLQPFLDDRVWEFSQSLVPDHETLIRLREDLDFYEDFSGLFWSVISEWNSNTVDGRRSTMLGQLVQACADCQLHNPLGVEVLPAGDRAIVEASYPILVEHLLVSLVLIYLRDSGLLSSTIVHYILDAASVSDQVLRLLDLLPIFGPTAVDILIRALRRSDQSHIAEVITREHPGRFQDTPDSPPPQPRRVTLRTPAMRSPRVEMSIKMFPQQTIETKSKKNFFRRPKWLFRSGKYQFNKK
ncbi:uncharacterized protein LOC124142215 [Haliotis rufescens]|uniref:uncharacterized protein LOC124142215 n=1 Tax=Haliotis rufescens TaxID=6454 RepID=UPI00201F1B53|nr:uncharacterized protein LOC124142215 [Haliotis rufescens]XP_046366504.2 uncharacterized protein LOC124142215 [Haliotis rufescens]